jgi:Domain of unknown function (DUF4372)
MSLNAVLRLVWCRFELDLALSEGFRGGAGEQWQDAFRPTDGFLPWSTFTRIVARYRGDQRVRTLSCAEHYRAMAFAQLTYRESLRDIEASHPRSRSPTRSMRSTRRRSIFFWRSFRGRISTRPRQRQDAHASDLRGNIPSFIHGAGCLNWGRQDLCEQRPATVSNRDRMPRRTRRQELTRCSPGNRLGSIRTKRKR